jgi:tetratricopeptide (TPR) repeat protein
MEKIRMYESRDFRFLARVTTVSFLLLFAAGCASRQKAVELYVDAVTLKDLKENDKAIHKLNEAIKADKRFSLAHSLLGEVYEQMGDLKKSAASYETAAQMNPWSFKDYFCLGRVYQTMKEPASAIKAYSKAIQLKPYHFEATLNIARCFYETNDYTQALAYCTKAEQIDPAVGATHQLSGNIYDSQKNYEQAVRSYKRAMEIDGNNADTMMSLAVAYLRTNRNAPAKDLLAAVTRLQPNNSSALQYLGYCFLRLDDVNQAIENYKKAIKINNQDWEAYRGLGVAYMMKSLNGEDTALKVQAVELWRQSLSIKPDQPRRDRLVKLIERYSK